MAPLDHYLSVYGPAAILLGAAFEGQTVVIAGGVLARQETISWIVALIAAALGSCLIDMALFVLGRGFRDSAFVQAVSSKPGFSRALGVIERRPSIFILSFRFLYGLRAAGPVAIGVSQIGVMRFMVLNAIAAVIWAGVFVGIGYAFGPAFMQVVGHALEHAAPIGAALGLAALVGFVFWRWRVATRPAPGARPGPLMLTASSAGPATSTVYQTPTFGMDAHGSAGGSAAPD